MKYKICVNRSRHIKPTVIFALSFLFSLPAPAASVLPKPLLIEDTRQMVDLIESIHPDPYFFGGGKIAFHRRFQQLLGSIDEQGMDINRYACLLLPFLAQIGDGHTYVIPPDWSTDQRIGLPVQMRTIGGRLLISGVYGEQNRSLLNCQLTRVEGISIDRLAERERNILAGENTYNNFRRLIDGLNRLPRLKLLVPEWESYPTIQATFTDVDGQSFQKIFHLTDYAADPVMITNKSSVILPSVEKADFAYRFLDSHKKTVLLRIEDMQTYRECHEHWRFYGNYYPTLAKKTYRRWHGKEPMSDIDAVIDHLPSATECFTRLVREMKENQSETLIIDLRRNPGGISNMTEILMYFLYGRKAIVDIESRDYQIRKHSDLYYSHNKGESFHPHNDRRTIAIGINDYDFLQERRFYSTDKQSEKKKEVLKALDEMASHMPTFEREYLTGRYEAWYTPENVVVLSSERTFSSGFWMLKCFKKAGAKVVGTPSGQAPNTFSDQNPYTLKNSGITLYLTYKKSFSFPGLPEGVDVIIPDYPLNYSKLKEYQFDPNGEIILALEILKTHIHE